MNRIRKAFAAEKAFIPFITGGAPDLETTEKLLYALSEAGANLIEIGIPFSDPIAEGPVIESANKLAISNGCTTDKLFDLVLRVRQAIKIPLLFMTYYNSVFTYGPSKFSERCVICGIDGLVVPDLPFEERDELLEFCKLHNIELISMIAPTSETRIAKIAENSSGFLYCVSSLGVTGERKSLDGSAKQMIMHAKQISDIPCAVGFGISTPEQAYENTCFADGVIIGSAIMRIVAEHGRDCIDPVRKYAKQIRQAISKNNKN